MAEFKSGLRALRSNLGPTQVSTCFTATTSGQRQISIWQLPNGKTEFREPITLAQADGLRISTSLRGFTTYLDTFSFEVCFDTAESYTEMYDFYTLDRVEVTMFVGQSWSAFTFGGTTVSTTMLDIANPVIWYTVDSQNVDEVRQFQIINDSEVQFKQPVVNGPIELSYTPSSPQFIGGFTLGNTGAKPSFSPKISTRDGNVQHFGVKMCPMGLTTDPPEDYPMSCVSFIVRQYVTFYDRSSRDV